MDDHCHDTHYPVSYPHERDELMKNHQLHPVRDARVTSARFIPVIGPALGAVGIRIPSPLDIPPLSIIKNIVRTVVKYVKKFFLAIAGFFGLIILVKLRQLFAP